jgi:hypothetical protein
MKIYAEYDFKGTIHSVFPVDASEGFDVIPMPQPGMFVGEVDSADIDLGSDSREGKDLQKIAENFKVDFPRARVKLVKRSQG